MSNPKEICTCLIECSPDGCPMHDPSVCPTPHPAMRPTAPSLCPPVILPPDPRVGRLEAETVVETVAPPARKRKAGRA